MHLLEKRLGLGIDVGAHAYNKQLANFPENWELGRSEVEN